MKQKKVLITGSGGLIGSEAVSYFAQLGFDVHGIDNNMRAYFFGKDGDTTWNILRIGKQFKGYHHYTFDIRDERKINDLVKKERFDLIIHTAAQPSHDWAAKEPMTDFSINAVATLVLLEAIRKYSKDSVFIFTSTNKVYGDNPNQLPFLELSTRYELPKTHKFYKGIDESMSLDQTTHSIFGVSKCSADLMVQEYGRYFKLKTVVFRGGCLTGPHHSAAKLHGFLAYLVKCIRNGIPYTIIGYKGKQVRDNIHSHDLINAFVEVFNNPKMGEVYNMGGSRFSNVSMKEAISMVESILGKKADIHYLKKPRIGDHIWYISDISKFKMHYPKWSYLYTLEKIIEDICTL
jgi:CDP-paratose 2-epimerase